MKRMACGGLVVLLVLAAALPLAASGQSDAGKASGAGTGNLNPPGTMPVVKNKVTINVISTYSSVETSGKPQDTPFTKIFEDRTNVHMNWLEVIESSQAQEKLNLMLASDDLPEAFMTQGILGMQTVFQYGTTGSFLPVDGYIEKYMPNLRAQLAKYDWIKKQLTMPDKRIYTLPAIEAGCYHCAMPYKVWVYQPWLDKLGLKMPATTTDFYNMLKAFKEKDPNGNGVADEIPLAGYVGSDPVIFLMNAFVYHPGTTYLAREGANVLFVANTNEWREGLKYMAKLTKEGLLSPDTFVQKVDQLKALAENPKVPLVGAAPALWYGVFTVNGGGTGRFADYQPMAPVAGPAGVRQTPLTRPTAAVHTVITKKARNPEALAQMLDWFYAMDGKERTKRVQEADLMWVEGKDYRFLTDAEKNSGKYVTRDFSEPIYLEITAAPVYGKEKMDAGWRRIFPNFDVNTGLAMPPEYATDPSKQMYRNAKATKDLYEPYKADKSLPPNLIVPKATMDENADIATAIGQVVGAYTTQFIVGTKDINSDVEWSKYLAELNNAGVKRYVEIWQKVAKDAGY